MRCMDIMRRLEVLAPLEFAEQWDNVGLPDGGQPEHLFHIGRTGRKAHGFRQSAITSDGLRLWR